MYAFGFGATLELLEMPVEPLDLGEEPHVEPIFVEHANGIMRIHGGDQPVPGGLDGVQMPRRNEAADAGHREILHGRTSTSTALPVRAAPEGSATALSVAASVGACTRREKRSSTVRRPATARRRRNTSSERSRDSFSTHSSSVEARNPF